MMKIDNSFNGKIVTHTHTYTHTHTHIQPLTLSLADTQADKQASAKKEATAR